MVHLTMTPSIVEALEKMQSLGPPADERNDSSSKNDDDADGKADESMVETQLGSKLNTGVTNLDGQQRANERYANGSEEGGTNNQKKVAEPPLSNPKVGNPISHGQVIDLSRQLKAQSYSPKNLEVLLRGARVYVPLPALQQQTTSEYKSLMARLRREEESRSYQRMTNRPPIMETFAQRFPSSAAHAFSSYQTPDPVEDEVTYADVDRQIALIFNVLISIVACAAALWIAARWWSTPARLALSMGGSLLVGVAEVVVYSGYIRRVGEAKRKEKGVKEFREVVRTWVIGGEEDEKAGDDEKSALITAKVNPDDVKARKRKKHIS